MIGQKKADLAQFLFADLQQQQRKQRKNNQPNQIKQTNESFR